MKIERKQVAEAKRTEPGKKFTEVLKKVTGCKVTDGKAPKQPHAKPVVLNSHSAQAQGAILSEHRAHATKVAEGLRSARSEMNAEAARLGEVRTEAATQTEQKVEGRVLDLIVNELSAEFGVKQHPDQQPTQPLTKAEIAAAIGGPVKEAKPEDVPRLDNLKALVEQIQLFVKNNRPAMAVSVGGSLNAHVEIERTGPKLVALKLVGRGALPRTQDLNAIREELAAKGIRVSVLEVAMGPRNAA